MKIKKHHISGYLKLIVSIAFLAGILMMSFIIKKDLRTSAATPTTSQEVQSAQTPTQKHKKKKIPKPSSTDPVPKKRNKRNNNKRPVSPSRRKKADVEAAERKAALECLLYEDGI
jgi:outer membrane biosynthesis protein TonB